MKAFGRKIIQQLPQGAKKRILTITDGLRHLILDSLEQKAQSEFSINYYLGDIRINVDPSLPIEREMGTGIYDPDTLAIINRFVRAGNHCFDIGANVGAITLPLAKKTGGCGRVYSFEAGKGNHERLATNLGLNPELKKRVIAEHYGISNENGTMTMMGHLGNLSLLNDPGQHPIEVDLITLDSYCKRKRIAKIDFVKIDVEAWELEVVQGAQSCFKKLKPIIYYETMKEHEAHRGMTLFDKIENILEPMGYRFFKVHPRAQIEETRYPDLTVNTLALPKRIHRGRAAKDIP